MKEGKGASCLRVLVNCRLICVFALGELLAGCWALPLSDTSDRGFDITGLESLLGGSEAAAIDEIGQPTYRITHNQADYLVYQGRLDSTGIVFMFWVPIGISALDDGTLDCLRLEFKGGVLQGYDIETRSATYHRWLYGDCRRVYWSAEKTGDIEPLLGATRTEVENIFGAPNWVVADNATEYLVYQYAHSIRNGCVLLDFGDENALRRYEVKSCGLFGVDCPTHPSGDIHWGNLDCRQLFWTLDELESLVPGVVPEQVPK